MKMPQTTKFEQSSMFSEKSKDNHRTDGIGLLHDYESIANDYEPQTPQRHASDDSNSYQLERSSQKIRIRKEVLALNSSRNSSANQNEGRIRNLVYSNKPSIQSNCKINVQRMKNTNMWAAAPYACASTGTIRSGVEQVAVSEAQPAPELTKFYRCFEQDQKP